MPEFSTKPIGGLHCLFLGEQSGPYIWGFLERGEAEAIAEALNRAVLRAALRGRLALNPGPQPLENEVATRLRANLDYVEAYLESAAETERESGLLMSASGLLGDVRRFLDRDDPERATNPPGRSS
jgi:hypothetical protein